MHGCWIMVAGTIFQTSATGSVQMMFSRIVTGIGNGINTVNVPIWQAETFKSHNRGVYFVSSIKGLISIIVREMKIADQISISGTFNRSERADRPRPSIKHIHGSSQQSSRTVFLCMEMAYRIPGCLSRSHSCHTTISP